MAAHGQVGLRLIGGPTVEIEYAGLRFLTDPTFDEPGEYRIGERALVKLAGPAVPASAVGTIDAVLLSHHGHPDNLDRSGRDLLASVPLTLATPASAAALGGTVRGLAPWESTSLGEGAAAVTVTAVPARHGPEGCEPKTGDVTGFVLAAPGEPRLYVSGDNAAVEYVEEIAARLGPIDVAVLFCGAARTPLIDAYLTLTADAAVAAARALGAAWIVPAHTSGWAHFSQGPDMLRAAFEAAGLSSRFVLLEPGERATLERPA